MSDDRYEGLSPAGPAEDDLRGLPGATPRLTDGHTASEGAGSQVLAASIAGLLCMLTLDMQTLNFASCSLLVGLVACTWTFIGCVLACRVQSWHHLVAVRTPGTALQVAQRWFCPACKPTFMQLQSKGLSKNAACLLVLHIDLAQR